MRAGPVPLAPEEWHLSQVRESETGHWGAKGGPHAKSQRVRGHGCSGAYPPPKEASSLGGVIREEPRYPRPPFLQHHLQ